MTALWPVLTDAPTAVNPPVVWPTATVTLVGTVKLVLFEAIGTTNPPEGAPAVRVTVQALFPGVLIVVGVQLTLARDTAAAGSETFPVLPTPGIEVPPAVEATTLVI